MSQDPTDPAVLHALCEETKSLAGNLRGNLRQLTVQAGGYRVAVKWEPAADGGVAGAGAMTVTEQVSDASAQDDSGRAIVAPLVGTFYRATEPGADPFVTEGGPVEAGQSVAIVEAMKIMNRIESDLTGTVRTILVEDGEMVEFGQRLMIIDEL